MSTESSSPVRSFINQPEDFLAEALGGIVAAQPDAQWHDEGFVARSSGPVTEAGEPAVAVISGGGSGHEPLHVGFVGRGMLAAAVPGHVFTSPNALQIQAATEFADQGRGVLQVVKNYTGDVMNFQVARTALKDHDVAAVIVADDVATESDAGGPGRRGILGTVIVEKVAGAAAERGCDLAEVTAVAERAAAGTRSMSVALAPGHLPTSGRDTFDLPEGKMELGVGIHGERGTDRVPAQPADKIVADLLDRITDSFAEAELDPADGVVLTVGGLGATTVAETHLVYGAALRWLAQKNIPVRRGIVSPLVTAVNMAGVSICLTVADEELLELIDAPTDAPAWPRTISSGEGFAPARMNFDDDDLPQGDENAWISGFVSRVVGALDDLTELDREAGDGDFGTNMGAAMGDLELPLHGTNAELLGVLSRRFLVRSGGTSGAVFGTLFRDLATAFEENDSFAAALADGLETAVRDITDLGGAKRGDNTMMDALIPAAEASRQASNEELLADVFTAAAEGARSTRDLVAKKGRASYVGESSKGVIDPGSIVTAWLFGGEGELGEFGA